MMPGSRAFRCVAVVLAMSGLAGCKSWHPATGTPAQVLADRRPTSLRIIDSTGRIVTVRHPTARNDSIVSSDTDPLGRPVRAEGVAFDQVAEMSVERFNPLKTALFAGALVAVGATWVKVNGGSNGGSNEPVPGPPKGFAFSPGDALEFVIGLWR